jgi:hypothetical protein
MQADVDAGAGGANVGLAKSGSTAGADAHVRERFLRRSSRVSLGGYFDTSVGGDVTKGR